MLKFRSVNNIVIAPARTGRERRSKIAVIKTDHTNKGIRSKDSPGERILIIVVIKLIAPKIDEIPAKWREKIAMSTEAPEWEIFAESGGYTVHPVPAPLSTKEELINKNKEGVIIKNLNYLFEEKLYLVHLILKELINFQIHQSLLV